MFVLCLALSTETVFFWGGGVKLGLIIEPYILNFLC